MKAYTRYKLEELVDFLDGKIRHGVRSGSPARFTADETAQYLLADVALSQDGQRKGHCAGQAKNDFQALSRRKAKPHNLSELFECALGRFGVAEMQRDLERAGMTFTKNRSLRGFQAPR